jgi:hypothetical protein
VDDSGIDPQAQSPTIPDHIRALYPSTDQFWLPVGLIPESKLQSVPDSKLVIDGPQFVLNDVFRSPHDNCHLAIVEALSDEFDHLLLSFIAIN